MNKRENAIAALTGGVPEHIPAAFWFHFGGDAAAGQGAVDAHIDYFKTCDLDMMKIMCDGYFDYPNPLKVEKAADWYDLKPLGAEHPFFAEQVARTRAIVEAVGREALVLYTVFAPFSAIRFGYSDELVMRTLREDPKAVCHALDVIAEDTKCFVKALFEAGADGIYYSVQGGEKNRFTVEEYRRLITPSDKAVLDYANTLGALNILHCCGWAGDKNNIEDWRDYTAAAVNWAVYVEQMDMKAGRAFFPNVKCVLGGLDNTPDGVLYKGTDDEVKAEIRRLCAETGKSGFIIGADCSIQSDTPYERIRLAVTYR